MIQAIHKYAVLKSVVDRCDKVVADTLKENTTVEANIALESFNNGGKRLRPALLILSSMISGGSRFNEVDHSLIKLAGAVELVHLATLFHDDVIDQVDTRRKKLSARLKYGNYASVLTGDYVLAEALSLVHKSGHLEALPEFIGALRSLVHGESIEIAHKYDYELSEDRYYEIISEKSASLFELSCKVGAIADGTDNAAALGKFGWNLGMAFQMIDDLDDLLDQPNKTYDCDLRNGYLALPMIGVLENLKDGHRDQLIGIIERGEFSPENEHYIVSLCLEYGTIQRTNDEIHRRLDRAREEIEQFGKNQASDILVMVVDDLKSYADNQVSNFANFLARRAS